MVCVALYRWKVVGKKGGARAQGQVSFQRAIKAAANIPFLVSFFLLLMSFGGKNIGLANHLLLTY